MAMYGTMNSDSSFLPISLSSFVKGPILVVVLIGSHLVSRVGRACMSTASTLDEVSCSVQGWLDEPVQIARFHEQIAAKGAI